MRHIFILQGKKFISSKRASKISDYSSDYIGQLCREEKLECKMIGHTWFVTEESLINHSTQVTSDEALKDRINNIRGSVQTDKVSTKEASEISGYTTDYVGQLCRGGKLKASMVGNTWYITKESLTAHVAKVHAEKERKVETLLLAQPKNDDVSSVSSSLRVVTSDFLPVLNKKNISTSDIADVAPITKQKYEPIEKIARETILARFFRGSILRKIAVATFSVVILVGVVSFIRSKNAVTTVATHEGLGSTASVYEAVESVVAFFRNSYENILAMFGYSNHLTLNTETPNAGDVSVPVDQNIAVVPSSGSVSGDEAMKEQIKNSFSDQVEVKTDKSGTAGVITPVFRGTKGKDFIYVMVPVKPSSDAANSATNNTQKK